MSTISPPDIGSVLTVWYIKLLILSRGRCVHDRMAVGFTTTYAISAYHHSGPVSSTKKTDGHDIAEILLKVALSTIKQTNKHFINNIINVRRLTIYLFYFIQCITLK